MSVKIMKAYQQLKQQINDSFDIVERIIEKENQIAYIFFLSSLSDNQLMESLCEGFIKSIWEKQVFAFYPSAITKSNECKEALEALFSGQSVVIMEDTYYLIETRSYPSRNSAEPINEQSIRGAHDGFVENIIFNVGLIRRRIRDPKLCIKIKKMGSISRRDIVYLYLDGAINQKILQDFERRFMQNEHIDCINEHDFVSLLYQKTWNPYPHVRYSERPDLCSLHVMQGYLVVLVDNCPCGIILPTTFFELMSQMEEYTQTILTANFTRLLRFCGILFSIYLLPLWCALLIDQNPTMLNLPMLDIHLYTFAFQVIFADIVIEWLRQGLIHTPTILSGLMSLIAVFVFGEMAIEKGAYTQEIIIMVALVNIGNALTPGYELAMANKIARMFLVVCALIKGQIGFLIGVILHIYLLIKAGHSIPYLYPFLPFSFKECWRMIKGGKA